LLATYLIGERVALRAMQLADKDHAMAWFEGTYPVNSERAEKYLREELEGLSNRKAPLVIMRVENDVVVGGVRVRLHQRHAEAFIQMAPTLDDADLLRGETIKLLIPWLRDEGQNITVTVDLATDQTKSIAAAEQSGMEQTARFREWYVRPGGRIDRLVYQAIHPTFQETEVSNA